MMKKLRWMTVFAVVLAAIVGCSSKGTELGKNTGPVATHEGPPPPGMGGAGGGGGGSVTTPGK